MKNVLLLAAAVLSAFAVGLAVTYFALPTLAPGRVAQADSLAAATDTAAALATKAHGDSTATRPPDGTEADSTERTTRAGSSPAERALRDSLLKVEERLRQATGEAAVLRAQTETLRNQLSAVQSRRMNADEIGSALAKMEEDELNALLREVDLQVLEQLYREASGRARTRLLRSMSPARAARFVNRLVDEPPARQTSAASPADPPAAAASSFE